MEPKYGIQTINKMSKEFIIMHANVICVQDLIILMTQCLVIVDNFQCILLLTNVV